MKHFKGGKSTNMKNKVRFIWFYSVLMFAVALLLILVSTLSQTRLAPNQAVKTVQQEENVFNQTIQQSVTDLVDEKQKLTDEAKASSEKIAELQTKIVALTKDNDDSKKVSQTIDFLIKAKNLFDLGQYKSSLDGLQNVNLQVLNDSAKELYSNLEKQLAKKGYKL